MPILKEKNKEYVKFKQIGNLPIMEEEVPNSRSAGISLHPKKSIREYVDMIQTEEIEASVFSLISKLKRLYFNRKTNPNKKGGKSASRNLKKRYIVGIKEVKKHLYAENLKMIIIAVNLERVEGENGLDVMIYDII